MSKTSLRRVKQFKLNKINKKQINFKSCLMSLGITRYINKLCKDTTNF